MRNGLAIFLFCALCLGFCTTAEAQRHHLVRPGQNLSTIARRHRVTVGNLAAANGLHRNSTLRTGQELRIPARNVVYVQAGHTLSEIAAAHRISTSTLARHNGLHVNQPLRIGQRLRLPGRQRAEQVETIPEDWGAPAVPGRVRLRRRGESSEIALRVGPGQVSQEGLQALGRVMLAREEDEARSPEPRLGAVLAAISDHFGGRPIELVSGFRSTARRYTRRGSRHVSGRAADIRIRGVANRVIWEFCLRITNTGCGFYPRSTFVHVDVRDSPSQWVDWSRPGRRPRYGTLRRAYRRRSRRLGRRRSSLQMRRSFDRELVADDVQVADRLAVARREVLRRAASTQEAESTEGSGLTIDVEGEGTSDEARGNPEANAESNESVPPAPETS